MRQANLASESGSALADQPWTLLGAFRTSGYAGFPVTGLFDFRQPGGLFQTLRWAGVPGVFAAPDFPAATTIGTLSLGGNFADAPQYVAPTFNAQPPLIRTLSLAADFADAPQRYASQP